MARLEREMLVIAQLNHPNIVRLLDAGRLEDERLYLALELVDGETLGTLCRRMYGLDLVESRHLMLQVLDAIAFAHEHGVVHRDLKPHNIMVTETSGRRHVKVLDFGIAALVGDARAPDYRALTATGEFHGTPAYMAPEQLMDKNPTPAADIYAWGLSFIECMTGVPVMNALSVAEVIFRQLSPEPVPIPQALRGHPLGAILERATAKSLDRRFRSAREAFDALEACDVSAIARADVRPVNQPFMPDPWSPTEGLRGPAMRTVNYGDGGADDAPMGSQGSVQQSMGGGLEAPLETREVAEDEGPDGWPAQRTIFNRAVQSMGAQRPGEQSRLVPPHLDPMTSGRPTGRTTRPSTTMVRGERRQMTLLACGLAGAAQTSEALDPEAFHDLLHTVNGLCAQIVESHGGTVERSPGDGLLAYFGHPIAREDDAIQAMQAALDLTEQVPRLAPQAGSPVAVAVQVGVHTGVIVVSEGTPHVAGPTLNIATHLKESAEPGTVLASRATQRLGEGYFHFDALGEITPRSSSVPVEIFALRHRTDARDRLDARTRVGLSPLVGRGEELDFLRGRWDRAASGSGQVVLLTGEAGIGKSRTVRAFHDQLGAQPHRWLEGRCSPQFQNSAFYPIIDLLNDLLSGDGDGNSARLARLERLLDELECWPYAVPLLAALLSIPTESRHLAPALSPQRQRQETIAVLLQLVLNLSDQAPLILVLEDVHWADPSSLELLGLLIEEARPSSLLMLLTARPYFVPPWPARPHFVQHHVAPLTAEEIEALIGKLAGEVSLPPEVIRTVAAQSDGVPIFAEELTKMVLESAAGGARDAASPAGPPGSLNIPATLHDSLMARLDRLGPAKEVAQIGSVLGRSFRFDVLQAVAYLDPNDLRQALNQLVDAELLFQRGRAPRATYTFKHALVQDAAYQSLLRSTRQQLHERIAVVLSERFPDTPLELLAHHYTEAGLVSSAVAAWRRAGQATLVASAHAEAINHLRRGLKLLQELPDTPERARDEVTLQTMLGVPLMITRGYAAPEVEAAYARANALCDQVSSSPQLFPALWGLWIFHHVRAEYVQAQQHGEKLLRLAEATGDSGILLGAHQALGATRFLRGHLHEARAHFEAAIGIYDPAQHHELAFLFGQDAAAFCRSHLSWLHWHLGEPLRAQELITEALDACARLNQPMSRGFVEHFAATLCNLLGDPKAAELHARALITLSEEVGMPHWHALGQIDLGWAMGAQGQPDEGATRIRSGLGMLIGIGARIAFTYWRAALIAAEIKMQHLDEARSLLDETLAFVEESDERYFEAELWLLTGDLALARGGAGAREEADAAFGKGLAIAQQQGAVGLATRARMRAAEYAPTAPDP
jgi:predicted ATPase/class 3 adenylate cyclase